MTKPIRFERTCLYCHLVDPRCLGIRSALLPCLRQSSRFIHLHNTLHFLRALRSHRRLPGGLGPHDLDRVPATRDVFPSCHLFRDSASPFDFWSFRAALCRLCGALTATFRPRLPWVRRTTSPYPVRLHVRSVLRISGLASSRRLDLLPNTI